MSTLSITKRPETLNDMYGCDRIKKYFYGLSASKKPFPTAMLFQGRFGTGKTTAAKIVASMLSCQNPKPNGDPCCECAACRAIINETWSQDAMMIDGGSVGKDDVIERVNTFMNSITWHGKAKVLIMEEVQELSPKAKNSMLKILETRRPDIYFIFTTMDSLAASGFTSRCQSFKFPYASITDVMYFLKKTMEDIGKWNDSTIPPEFKTEGLFTIASNASGSYRQAIQTLEQCLDSQLYTVSDIVANTGADDNKGTYEILSDMMAGKIDNETFFGMLVDGDYQSKFNLMYKILSDARSYKTFRTVPGGLEYFESQAATISASPCFPFVISEFKKLSVASAYLKKADFISTMCDIVDYCRQNASAGQAPAVPPPAEHKVERTVERTVSRTAAK